MDPQPGLEWPGGVGYAGARHLLLSFCGRLKNILVKIHSHQALALLLPWQVKADHLVDAVVDGPVELLGLVTGQNQHEPAATDAQAEGLAWCEPLKGQESLLNL